MIIILAIFQNFIQAATDVADKFFVTAKKIEPISYTFFTIVTGILLIVIWPFVYSAVPTKFIWLCMLSGAWYSLAYYVFYTALSQGEVSRVVPFVFGLMPIISIIIELIIKTHPLSMADFAALCLLIPGALLITYKKKFFAQHILIKIVAAVLLSSQNFMWQYAAQKGNVLSDLIWNRIGAAAVLVILLVIPAYRKKVFAIQHVEQKQQTSILFVLKQLIGGANFALLSYLLAVGSIPIISALQGFRYIFLFIFGLIFSAYHSRILQEQNDKHAIRQKLAAIALMVLGTVFLFV